jgi:hypothetical protein
MANSASIPPLHREPRRIRPPFDVAESEPVDGRQAEETAHEFRVRQQADRVAALMEALDGVELGEYDRRIIDWLSVWDNATVGTVASLIYRARELGGAS